MSNPMNLPFVNIVTSLFRFTSDVVVFVDGDLRVCAASKRYVELTGMNPGDSFTESLDPFTVGGAERVFAGLRDSSQEDSTRGIMHHRPSADERRGQTQKTSTPVHYTWVASLDDDGNVCGFLGIGHVVETVDENDEILELRNEIERFKFEDERRNREINRLRKQVETQSHNDPLTELGNRRFVLDRLKSELSRAVRYDESMTIMLFDIDHMTRVNEIYGQESGDAVIRRISEEVRNQVRETDIVARYDGAQFMVLCPHTDRASSQFLAERLRRRIAEVSFHGKRDGVEEEFGITISIGMATVNGSTEFEMEALLHAVHQALDAAKLGGVNRVQLV